jgi:hypothetical protein
MEKIRHKIKGTIKIIGAWVYILVKIIGIIIIGKGAVESNNLILFLGGLIYVIIFFIDQYKMEQELITLRELQLELYRLSKTQRIEKNFKESEVINKAIRKGEMIEFDMFNNMTTKGWNDFQKDIKNIGNSKLK